MQSGKYFLETFGCQMNILDSQLVEAQLQARGMSAASSFSEADLILFNTCSVRQHAEDKVHSRLGHLKRLKAARPDVIIGVLGCMAERVKEDLFVSAPHVDLLCGPGELNRLPTLLDEITERHERVTALAGSMSRRTEVLKRALEYDSLEALDLARTPDIEGSVLQSYVRVQRGCDKFCTYCVVPFVRGPERSRPPAAIVDEVRRLAEHGCREVTLLGQTVNSYAHLEDDQPVSFAKLLERVHAVEEIDRVRFVTSFPADWDEDIFRVMRDYPRVMPYLHIPAQSGSNRVLKNMRRTYTAESYLELMDTARKYVPDIALAGDFIVGFCGETEEDFQQTADLIRRVQYESLFIFKYSPRPGTKADRREDDIPDDVKAWRNNELLAVQNEISHARKRAMIGREVEVLVEGPSKAARKAQGEQRSQLRTRGKAAPAFIEKSQAKEEQQRQHAIGATEGQTTVGAERRGDAGTEERRNAGTEERAGILQLVGRTPGDAMALFDAPLEYTGAIVKVLIEDASPNSLFGRVIEVVSPPRAAGGKPSHA